MLNHQGEHCKTRIHTLFPDDPHTVLCMCPLCILVVSESNVFILAGLPRLVSSIRSSTPMSLYPFLFHFLAIHPEISLKRSGNSKWGGLSVLANSWWNHPGRAAVEYRLCLPDFVLACYDIDIDVTLIQQQPSVRTLFRFVVRLIATRNTSCPHHHHPRLFGDTWMVLWKHLISFWITFIFQLNWTKFRTHFSAQITFSLWNLLIMCWL